MAQALGGHTLMEGDCLSLLCHVPDGSVDMVFADLPYGATCNAYDADANGRRMDAKPIHKKTYPLSMATLWRHLLRAGKSNAAFIFTATQPFASYLVYSNPSHFKYELIWDKVRAGRWMNAKNMPLARHENLLIFYRRKPTYNPQMVLRDGPPKIGGVQRCPSSNYSVQKNRANLDPSKIYTHKFPDSLLRMAKDTRALHPNAKPVALLEWLIRTYSNGGDTILDPCAGSGTTLIACENTGRRCIAIEREATYCETIRKRWSAIPAQLFSVPM